MTQLRTSPRTKRAANVLGIVLLIALVAPFAVYAAPEVVGADESFVVLTASMTPAIEPGDVVIVAERDPTAIAEGDVITFVRGTSDVPVTHRVVNVVDGGDGLAFETRGDANEGPDPGLVPAANLVGAVTLTVPYIGYVIQFAGTQAGFVALVLLPFGLLAVTEVWSIVRSRNGSDAPAATADAPTDADGGETTEAEAPTGPAVTPDAPVVADSGGVSVEAVGGAAAVLVAVAPYAVYVAFELRTAASIAVAVGSSTLLLGALATWVPASGVLDRSQPSGAAPADEPSVPIAADGGSADTGSAVDEDEAGARGGDPKSDGAGGVDPEAVAADAERAALEGQAAPTARPETAGEVD